MLKSVNNGGQILMSSSPNIHVVHNSSPTLTRRKTKSVYQKYSDTQTPYSICPKRLKIPVY